MVLFFLHVCDKLPLSITSEAISKFSKNCANTSSLNSVLNENQRRMQSDASFSAPSKSSEAIDTTELIVPRLATKTT